MNDLSVLISADRIHQRVGELAVEIETAYADTPSIHVVGVLHGGFVFTSDLIRRIRHPLTVDFLRVSSYDDRTATTGRVTWRLEPGDVRGRHVLLVEDIVDSGHTLGAIRRRLLRQRPTSLRTVTLLDKPARRTRPAPVEFVGFTIDDVFVVGYGLDRAGRHRELPYIAVETAPSAPSVQEPSPNRV